MTTAKDDLIRKAIESAGGQAALLDDIAAFDKNMGDLDRRICELRQSHPSHWVAMQDGEMLIHPDTLDDLLDLIAKAGWGGAAAIRYIHPEPVKFIL